MVDSTDGLEYAIGQGYSALDAQAARSRLDGFAVVTGLTPSAGSSGLEVDIASGDALVGTDANDDPIRVSNSGTTVTLSTADSQYPRKDVVYVDDTGTVQVAEGGADPPLPETATGFDTYQPEPPLVATGTVLAEVFVAAGATTLGSGDVRDRRQPAKTVASTVRAESVSTDEINTVHSPTTAQGISDAISTINTEGGDALLLLPEGDIDVSGVVPFNLDVDDVMVIGRGKAATKLDASGSGNDVWRLTNTSYGRVRFAHFEVEGGNDHFVLNDFHEKIESVLSTQSSNIGLRLNGCFNATFEDVEVRSATQNVQAADSSTDTCNRMTFKRCTFSGNTGVKNVVVATDDSGNRSDTVVFRDCLFGNAGEQHLVFEGVRNPVIDGCRFESGDNDDSTGIGYLELKANSDGTACKGGRIVGSYFDGTPRSGSVDADYAVELRDVEPGDTDPISVTVKNNFFRDFADEAVIARANATNPVLGPNTVQNCPGHVSGGGTRIIHNGVIEEALGGSAPGTPSNYPVGVKVEDTSNSGDVYLKLPSSGFTQIGT